MKKLILALVVGLGCTALSVGAQQTKPDEHAGHHPESAPAMPPAKLSSDGANDVSPQRMQSNMKKMQDLMGKIQASKDPKEVELLLDEHMKMMRGQMKAMHQMGGSKDHMMGKDMMGGKGMKEGPGKDSKGPMMNDEMMRHHEHMMEHMQMMHGMMEQMMEHMNAEHQAMKAAPKK